MMMHDLELVNSLVYNYTSFLRVSLYSYTHSNIIDILMVEIPYICCIFHRSQILAVRYAAALAITKIAF